MYSPFFLFFLPNFGTCPLDPNFRSWLFVPLFPSVDFFFSLGCVDLPFLFDNVFVFVYRV